MSESEPQHLLVYGILRREFDNDHAKLLRAHCRFLGEGAFEGRLFDVGTHPAAIAAQGSATVRGEAYRILRPKPLFPVLDRLEGCGTDDPEPHLYRRERISVRLDSGRGLLAWVYLYNRDTDQLRPIPHGDCARHLGFGRKSPRK